MALVSIWVTTPVTVVRLLWAFKAVSGTSVSRASARSNVTEAMRVLSPAVFNWFAVGLV